jgi:hypothetical protein
MSTSLPQEDKALMVCSLVSATISMTAFFGKQNNDSNQQSTLVLDESIEEMTSTLIDDTTMNQLTGEPRNRLAKLGSAKVLPQSSRQGFFHDKALPRLPRLSFDGGDDWITAPCPAITAPVGVPNEVEMIADEEEHDSFPPPVSRQPAHARKSSAPPLPCKSSKRRRRQREPKEFIETRNTPGDENRQLEPRKLSKTPQQSIKSPFSPSSEITKAVTHEASPDVSHQIKAMLVASMALKPEGDSSSSSMAIDSPALSKNSGKKGSGVLSKMRSTITGHLHDKGLKKHHNLAKSEYLLDPNLNHLPDYDEEASTISDMELRINEGSYFVRLQQSPSLTVMCEGINFRNPKIQSLIGHGTIRREPIADDGRSLMSRKSVEVISIEDVRTTGARVLTSFDSRRQSKVSFDRSADIISSVPGRSQRFKDESRRPPGARKMGSGFEVDFDALFSSSPVAQSTPRIRLEPTYEESGDKKLRNVPADSRSLFDPNSSMREPLSDLAINSTPPQSTPPRRLIVKRNNSQVKDVSLDVKSHISKRRKKHPSPSKAELEGLEDALVHYSPRLVSTEVNMQEELTLRFGGLRTGETLKYKDSNAPMSQVAKCGKKGDRLGLFGKPKPASVGSSIAEPAMQPLLKALKPSIIPKPTGAPTMKRRTENRKLQQLLQTDESAMDTDELQWESTAYHIGMKG